jgi:peroxiredoxin
LHKEFGSNENLVMLSVSLDEDRKALERFIEARKMNWLHVFGEEGGVRKASDAYGVVGIPAVFLIGPDGRIVGSDLRGAAVKGMVKKLLDERER